MFCQSLERKIQKGYFTGKTDSNGNIYPQIDTTKYTVLSTYAVNLITSLTITTKGDYFIFHVSDFGGSVQTELNVTVFYTYYKG